MARKKKPVVAPKVAAPKVVAQARPTRRNLWLALSAVGVILLAVWFGYDHGRSRQAGTDNSDDAALEQDPQQRIDRLEQRVARLERELQAVRKPARDPEAIVRALAGKQPPPPATVPTPAPGADPPTAVAEGPPNQLQLTDLEIQPTDSDNTFRYRFSVRHPGNDAAQVVGTIWIAVNGLWNSRPVRLSLKQISSATRPYLDMRFKGSQGVDGELTLPPGFEPKNIAIEAKPYDQKYRGASGKFDWTTTAGRTARDLLDRSGTASPLQ